MHALADTLRATHPANTEPGQDGAPVGEAATPVESLYLAGRPTLREFIRFVRGRAVAPPDSGSLIEEWNLAHARVSELERDEAGFADHPPVCKLGPQYERLLLEFFKDPLVQHSFNTVPTDIAIVPLDRLVVYQKHLDLTFARCLEQRLGPAPSVEQIFRTCLPSEHPAPPVKWSGVHRDSFVFVSPSHDLRFLGTMPLQPGQIVKTAPRGALVGVVGIAVGFGSNFLNAIHADNRLILNNGTHRAFALRELGVTHAPCIIQYASSREELDVVAPSAVRENPAAFLEHPRPALLKDYCDPALRKIMTTRRRQRQVTVRFQVEEGYIPAL